MLCGVCRYVAKVQQAQWGNFSSTDRLRQQTVASEQHDSPAGHTGNDGTHCHWADSDCRYRVCFLLGRPAQTCT